MDALVKSDQRLRVGFLLALVLGGLGAATSAKAACTVGDTPFLSTPSGLPHEGFSAGDRVNGAGGRASIFRSCDRGAGADLSIKASIRYHGDVDGIPTFVTSHSDIGVQFRYRYIESISGSGQNNWSSWVSLGDAAQSFHAVAQYEASAAQTGLPFEIEAYYIALRDIAAGGSEYVNDLPSAVELTDNTYGQDLNAIDAYGFVVRPRTYASCSFSSSPPSDVTLEPTHVSTLRNAGDMGPARRFSFGWSCVGGDDRGGEGDFKFTSSKALTTDGRISVDGSAKGADMLVTVANSSGVQEPVKFDRWYSNGRPLPSSGSRNMEVRFIRNSEDLQPGDATSTMTITVELY